MKLLLISDEEDEYLWDYYQPGRLADYDMILRILKAGYKTAYIPHVLVCMEVGGASNKNTKARLSKTQEDYIVLKKNNVGAGYLTVACKQLRKIVQFIRKK